MKYRFRPATGSYSSRLRRPLRLAGRATLQKKASKEFYPLRDPEPYLCPIPPKRASRFSKIRLRIAEVISSLLQKIRAKEKREAPHKSLPVLSGALCGALCVTLSIAILSFLFLSLPYRRPTRSVTVPDLRGKDPLTLLSEDESFNLVLREEINPNVKEGLVISQSPSPGVVRRLSTSEPYCTLYLTVSRAKERYRLEDLEGLPLREASLILRNQGIRTTIIEEYSSKSDGIILGTLPVPGTLLDMKEVVTLRVSIGQKPAHAYVPDLSGLSESEAIAKLHRAGLREGTVSYRTSSRPIGTVIAQEFSPQTIKNAYSEIGFSVSLGDRYEIRTVPDLYGRSTEEATAILREYGLTVLKLSPLKNPAPKGTVITQDPLPGTPITAETYGVALSVSAPSYE